jgi:hypothetical protein
LRAAASPARTAFFHCSNGANAAAASDAGDWAEQQIASTAAANVVVTADLIARHMSFLPTVEIRKLSVFP